jgi:hypothetical protein
MMTIFEIQSYIDLIEKHASLHDEKKFEERIEVIDFIEFHVFDQIQEIFPNNTYSNEFISLKVRAEKIKIELENIDVKLFQKLRSILRISKDKKKEFKNQIINYVDYHVNYTEKHRPLGYDNLDIFINGLLDFQTIPEQTKDLEPEMVYYQKTPARFVFELVEKSCFMKGDVFIDIGSGLGQVSILVNLLTGITTQGIEFDPSFCSYSSRCASGLNLCNITFINIDARKADYSKGNIFFMFTPFTGEIMQDVLEILRKQSLTRKIRVITYGPCTPHVAMQNWLQCTSSSHVNIYELGIFNS